jgi:DNA invertase Pin-like site-specific DNA recombinase
MENSTPLAAKPRLSDRAAQTPRMQENFQGEAVYGIRIIERIAAKGAMLKALDRQWLDLTTPLGKGILVFLSALAEDERARILARANGGRAAARKRGVKFGPKPKLAPHQEREAVRMVCQDGQSLRAVARHDHVGHSTIVRALERASSIA